MDKSIKSEVTLKSLYSRLEKEKAELGVLEKQRCEIVETIKKHSRNVNSLKAQIADMTKDKLVLSEHAKLRFLERVELIDVNDIENKVITDELIRMWKVLGNAEFPIGIGEHTCTIKNGVITTIK